MPLQYDFGQATGDSLLFLDAQRVGALPANNPIPWRGNSLLYENATKLNSAFSNLSGGWMQGGHAGAPLLWFTGGSLLPQFCLPPLNDSFIQSLIFQ